MGGSEPRSLSGSLRSPLLPVPPPSGRFSPPPALPGLCGGRGEGEAVLGVTHGREEFLRGRRSGWAQTQPPLPPKIHPPPTPTPAAHLVPQVPIITEAPLEAARLRAGGGVRGRHGARTAPYEPPQTPSKLSPPLALPSPPPPGPAPLPWKRRRRKWRERDANPRPRRAALPAVRVGGQKSARGAALKGAASPTARACRSACVWMGTHVSVHTHVFVHTDVNVHTRISRTTRVRVHA